MMQVGEGYYVVAVRKGDWGLLGYRRIFIEDDEGLGWCRFVRPLIEWLVMTRGMRLALVSLTRNVT